MVRSVLPDGGSLCWSRSPRAVAEWMRCRGGRVLTDANAVVRAGLAIGRVESGEIAGAVAELDPSAGPAGRGGERHRPLIARRGVRLVKCTARFGVTLTWLADAGHHAALGEV